MSDARLIGFDWGTTNLRAALLDGAGAVIEQRVGESGVGHLAAGDFAARFDELVHGWPEVPAMLAGMVGSAQGWADAGYVDAPARMPDLASALARLKHGARPVAIVPGVAMAGDRPDVMRGEETQIAGLLERRPHFSGTVVMPGTHSKWVRVSHGRIHSFHTYMTGDLFDAIGKHTILRHSVKVGPATSRTAFADAFASAFRPGSSVWGQLFPIRAASLLQGMSGEDGREKLSGFLVGAEFAAARADGYLDDLDEDRLTLIGTGSLVERYGQAARIAGVEATAYQGTSLVWPALTVMARTGGLT